MLYHQNFSYISEIFQIKFINKYYNNLLVSFFDMEKI